jgi:hypothetical protein
MLWDVSYATAMRRKAMHISMGNALALMLWHDFRLLLGDLTGSGFVWLLIGILLVFVVICALAMQAALVIDAPHRLQCRASWTVDVTESTVTVSPSPANLDDSGTPT